MKNQLILILAGIFMINHTVISQISPSTDNRFNHALGVTAGFTTGYGLSYRLQPGKLGAMITFAPNTDTYQNKFNAGFTLLYKVVETEKANLFIYQGNALFYSKLRVEENNSPWISSEEKKATKKFNNGIGLGIECIIVKRISFNLMGGYAKFGDFDNIHITGETGLYFRF